MRARVGRHLQSPVFDFEFEDGQEEQRLLTASFSAAGKKLSDADLPPEFNWRDYTSLLLNVAAEIEHSLMVQYLFAAYSMGGPQVPDGLRGPVRSWQELILDVAKEEMGHLVTVQNVRTALGLPLHLNREEYPWRTNFYPFGFNLQRLTLQSAAMYVCAESPADWSGEEAEEIKQCATEGVHGAVNRVGALYEVIEEIVRDPSRIPDTAIDTSTVPRQASWDEWGRGYSKEAHDDSSNLPGVPNPDLLILEVSSRDTLLNAIAEIGEQGEGPVEGEDSHFTRFKDVYHALKELDPAERDLVSRRIQPNPTADSMKAEPTACGWAHLFNLRYRMLLVNLSHAFQLPELQGDGASVNPRGALIHRTFAEMYNLRAIAANLVEFHLPGSDLGEAWNAAPPFEMPYTLTLPLEERNRWVVHRNLLEASGRLIEELSGPGARGGDYLRALADADGLALAQVDRMLGDDRAGAAAGAGS